jgi:hypothetical protein
LHLTRKFGAIAEVDVEADHVKNWARDRDACGEREVGGEQRFDKFHPQIGSAGYQGILYLCDICGNLSAVVCCRGASVYGEDDGIEERNCTGYVGAYGVGLCDGVGFLGKNEGAGD